MLKHKIFRVFHLLLQGKAFTQYTALKKHRKSDAIELILPEIHLEELHEPEEEITILEQKGVDGNVTYAELEAIIALVTKYQPAGIFEIGTYDGRTTLNMAAHTNDDTTIFTLDLPPKQIYKTKLRIKTGDMKFIDKPVSGQRFISTRYAHRIHQIYADSAQFDYSPYLNSIDFVFIDGSHSYEYVKNDTEIARKLLRNGKGIIVWHDYGWHEVVKALNEYFLEDEFFAAMKRIAGTSLAFLHRK